MALLIFEYECANHHWQEKLRKSEDRHTPVLCTQCEELAEFRFSAPRINLEGCSGHFPTASDAWARKHVEATKVARKKAESHGEE